MVHVTKVSKPPVLGETLGSDFSQIFGAGIHNSKETILREKFYERVVIPNFMMSGISYLLPKNNVSNPTKNSLILCQTVK